MSLEKEIKEFQTILKNTKKENNPNPFEQRLLRKVIKLIQQLQTTKEENEKLKKDKITKADLRRELNYQCEVVELLKEEMELAPLCVQSCNVDCEIKQLREKINQLAQQNKQMREALENIAIVQDNRCYCNRRSQLCPDCSLTTILNIAKEAICD